MRQRSSGDTTLRLVFLLCFAAVATAIVAHRPSLVDSSQRKKNRKKYEKNSENVLPPSSCSSLGSRAIHFTSVHLTPSLLRKIFSSFAVSFFFVIWIYCSVRTEENRRSIAAKMSASLYSIEIYSEMTAVTKSCRNMRSGAHDSYFFQIFFPKCVCFFPLCARCSQFSAALCILRLG